MVTVSFDNAALFVLGMQHDFVDGSFPVPGAAKVINGVNLWVEIFEDLERPLVYSMDWHGEDSGHFSKHPTHCVKGTVGAQIHKDVIYAPVDMDHVYTVLKVLGHDDGGHSILYEASEVFATHKKGLQYFESVSTVLSLHAVDTVFVVGVATEFCLRDTVIDLLQQGKHVLVVDGAIAGRDEAKSLTARWEMEDYGALFVDLDGVVMPRLDIPVAV